MRKAEGLRHKKDIPFSYINCFIVVFKTPPAAYTVQYLFSGHSAYAFYSLLIFLAAYAREINRQIFHLIGIRVNKAVHFYGHFDHLL